MARQILLTCLLASIAIPLLSSARQAAKPAESSQSAANPEMGRLAKTLAGDWNTTETMERSQFFPNGGSRRGIAHVHLTAGGTTLINEVHSNGSAGPLDGLVAIWWDGDAKLYRFFTCFRGSENPCKVRGTAHWEGDTFVNDYEEMVDGKMTKWRDSWIHITPRSHTLVAAMDIGNGTMKTFVTSTGTRR